MKKRVLVLTGSDEKMHEVLKLTIPSKKRYAKKYNYDFVNRYSFDEEITKYGLGIGFARFICAFNYLTDYDTVMWIDADSIITNYDYPIESFINENQMFYASFDWVGYSDFSTGNFILSKTAVNDAFFEAFINTARLTFYNHQMAEQITLNHIHNYSNFRSHFCVLDHKYLNAVPRCVEKTTLWSSDPVRTGPNKTNTIVSEWKEDCFLAHLTGCSNEDRVNLLLTEFKNYL